MSKQLPAPGAPHTGKFVAYYRVSTVKQGKSGLGLEAQEMAVQDYLDGGDWQLIHSYREVESGRRNDRPELEKALKHAKLTGAILIVAKLDRLSRNAAFLLALRDSGVRFVAADMPEVSHLTVGVLAVVAEDESRRISERTKAAMAAAKARGRKFGQPKGTTVFDGHRDPHKAGAAMKAKADQFAADLEPVVKDIQAGGTTSLTDIARELNGRSYLTPRGRQWTAQQVRRLLMRLPE